MRHETVNHDGHGDRREDEGARHGRHRSKPVAESDVDDGERREDAKPDHQRELMLARRWDAGTVVVRCSHATPSFRLVGRACRAVRMSSWTRSALIEIAAADPSPAAVMTCARGFAAFPAAQTPGTLVLPAVSPRMNPRS